MMDNDLVEVACALCGKRYTTTIYETVIDGSPIMIRSKQFCSKKCSKKFAKDSGQEWNGEHI
ncbi:Uncharacterised protein [Candidatus Gugararchaeum adminiculabundum]|nr:Uncharacterised protein [Candidatus Gugararchaeum adminiculabundum]